MDKRIFIIVFGIVSATFFYKFLRQETIIEEEIVSVRDKTFENCFTKNMKNTVENSKYTKAYIYGRKFNVVPNRWWNIIKNGKWERTTFSIIDQFLTKDMIYIGFGTWIGPMLLYAGSIAKHAYGFEPDKFAFEEACRNIAHNSQYHISLFQICISNVSEVLEMTGMGGSGSIVKKKASTELQLRYNKLQRSRYPIWQVQCQTIMESLPNKFEEEQLFIKIDAEGAESYILPSWRSWIKSFRSKPLMLISFHGSSSVSQTNEILKVLKLYKFYVITATGGSYENKKFKQTSKCWNLLKTENLTIPEWGDVFVTDIAKDCT